MGHVIGCIILYSYTNNFLVSANLLQEKYAGTIFF